MFVQCRWMCLYINRRLGARARSMRAAVVSGGRRSRASRRCALCRTARAAAALDLFSSPRLFNTANQTTPLQRSRNHQVTQTASSANRKERKRKTSTCTAPSLFQRDSYNKLQDGEARRHVVSPRGDHAAGKPKGLRDKGPRPRRPMLGGARSLPPSLALVSLTHPYPFCLVNKQAKMYIASKKACRLPQDPKLAFCYDILNSVSRRCACGRCAARCAAFALRLRCPRRRRRRCCCCCAAADAQS